MVAQNGDYAGTEINSDRMLWSMAGNLAMVHRVFMGINLQEDGILFAPAIPKEYPGSKKLSNFRCRGANLSITVNGTGNTIAAFKLDGKALERPFFSANLTGNHVVEIDMDNKPFDQAGINMVENRFSLPEPKVSLVNGNLSWPAVDGAVEYLVYRNGIKLASTRNLSFALPDTLVAEYKVSAVDAAGYESFTSEPLMPALKTAVWVEAEQFAAHSRLPYVGFSGKGFIELAQHVNSNLNLVVEVPEAGQYLMDLRYSNGSGPWNTDNKCAIRSLYTNGQFAGSFVFPQRGKDEWSEWGWSNSRVVNLSKGPNALKLMLEPWNINMNVDVNTAMLDGIRLLRVR
jgi:hypothetical protein